MEDNMEVELIRLRKRVKQQKKALRAFDDLTDVLTEGYGAASCINPLVDMENSIIKIRKLLAELKAYKERAENQEPVWYHHHVTREEAFEFDIQRGDMFRKDQPTASSQYFNLPKFTPLYAHPVKDLK